MLARIFPMFSRGPIAAWLRLLSPAGARTVGILQASGTGTARGRGSRVRIGASAGSGSRPEEEPSPWRHRVSQPFFGQFEGYNFTAGALPGVSQVGSRLPPFRWAWVIRGSSRPVFVTVRGRRRGGPTKTQDRTISCSPSRARNIKDYR